MRKAPKGPTSSAVSVVPAVANAESYIPQRTEPEPLSHSLSHDSSIPKLPAAVAASSLASTLPTASSASSLTPHGNRKIREIPSKKYGVDRGAAKGTSRAPDAASVAVAQKAAAVKVEPLVSLKGEFHCF